MIGRKREVDGDKMMSRNAEPLICPLSFCLLISGRMVELASLPNPLDRPFPVLFRAQVLAVDQSCAFFRGMSVGSVVFQES